MISELVVETALSVLLRVQQKELDEVRLSRDKPIPPRGDLGRVAHGHRDDAIEILLGPRGRKAAELHELQSDLEWMSAGASPPLVGADVVHRRGRVELSSNLRSEHRSRTLLLDVEHAVSEIRLDVRIHRARLEPVIVPLGEWRNHERAVQVDDGVGRRGRRIDEAPAGDVHRPRRELLAIEPCSAAVGVQRPVRRRIRRRAGDECQRHDPGNTGDSHRLAPFWTRRPASRRGSPAPNATVNARRSVPKRPAR